MRRIYCAILVFVLLLGAEESFSQMNRRAIKKNNKRISSFRGKKTNFSKDKVYSMVGLSVSALNYYGDLAPKPSQLSSDITFTRSAVGLSFAHRFGPRYTLTGTLMFGALKGSDNSADKNDADNGVFRYDRNLSFRNRIQELSVIASIDLFENQSTYISRVPWTPYIFAGVSVFHHNPQAQVPEFQVDGVTPFPNAGEWVDLQPLGTEGQYSTLEDTDVNSGIKPYKRIQIAIPMGIGARFRINEVLDISGEIGFRYTFTDYLDDVSQNYVDLGVFDSELARAMSYRTNEVVDDPARLKDRVARNGVTYKLVDGYGQEAKDNVRGSKNNKDIFMVTSIRVTYILGKTFHRAKFR